MPKDQLSQKCPICYKFLLLGQIVEYYKGPDNDYKNWLCHADCNKIVTKTSTTPTTTTTESKTPN